MDISIFSRGIKVKTKSQTGSIKRVTSPTRAVVLLRQCASCECDTTVEKGAKVMAGQMIARAKDSDGADLHSPVSGQIVDFEDVVLTDGSKCRAVIIRSDGKDTPEKSIKMNDDLVPTLKAAGIVVTGRDGSTLAKVLTEARRDYGHDVTTGKPIVRRVDHLVVRCCDVDPHLKTQKIVTERLDDLLGLAKSIAALVKLTSPSAVHFVLDKNQQAAKLEKYADEMDYAVHRVDASRYPMAANPFLAKKVSGKEPSLLFHGSNLSGTIVLDIATVLELAATLETGMPVVEKTITVIGPKETVVCKARVGTSLTEIVEAVGMAGDYDKVIIEGPLGGSAVHTLDYPVTKNMSGLTLIPKGSVDPFENEPCTSCGLCTMVCPTRLVPGMLSRYCEYGQFEQAENAHLFNCIECGCCAYVCPAGRSMVQFMVLGKSELIAARRVS